MNYLPPTFNSSTFNSALFNHSVDTSELNYLKANYLPLGGGTLTGSLTGTTITSTKAAIGTTATTYPLTIGSVTNTLIASYGYLASNGTTGTGSNTGAVNFSLYTNGRIACAGEIDVFSDRKLKENIVNITDEQVDLFMNQVSPKYYNKIGSPNLELGYIAQDLGKTTLSGLVNLVQEEGAVEHVDEDGYISPKDHILTVNYQKVVCLLHAKIQMQDKAINDLIDRLERYNVI